MIGCKLTKGEESMLRAAVRAYELNSFDPFERVEASFTGEEGIFYPMTDRVRTFFEMRRVYFGELRLKVEIR